MRVCLCLLALAAFSLHAATPPKNETVHGKLVVRSGEAPVIETAEHKRIVLDGDQPTRKVLHDPRVNGFEVEARGHFTAPDKFQIDPQHTRALVVHGGRQAQDDHLLVRRVLHSRVRARAVRLLPEGYGPGPARPGRYSMSDYTVRQTGGGRRSTRCSSPTPRTRWNWRLRPGSATWPTSGTWAGENYLVLSVCRAGGIRARPRLCGVPFLGPWANRLDGDAYWANGKRYQLESESGQPAAATAIRSRFTECWDFRRHGNWPRPKPTIPPPGPAVAWNSGGIPR